MMPSPHRAEIALVRQRRSLQLNIHLANLRCLPSFEDKFQLSIIEDALLRHANDNGLLQR